jgi:hypothetical protein
MSRSGLCRICPAVQTDTVKLCVLVQPAERWLCCSWIRLSSLSFRVSSVHPQSNRTASPGCCSLIPPHGFQLCWQIDPSAMSLTCVCCRILPLFALPSDLTAINFSYIYSSCSWISVRFPPSLISVQSVHHSFCLPEVPYHPLLLSST